MSYLLDQIKVYPNTFNLELLESLFREAHNSSNWGFQNSTLQETKYKFLILQLSNYEERIVKMLNTIKEITNQNFKIHRVYINAQHFGMPGKPHTDDTEPNRYTFLVYLNPDWNYMWGGQTVFLDEYVDVNTKERVRLSSDAIIKFPAFNCGILFPSNIYHYAEAPTKDYYDFRMTLALKLEKIS